MSNPPRSMQRDGLILLLLLTIYFVALMGLRPLSVPDEGRYPEVAREMLLTHDYITPRVNGIVFLDKPILYYWLQAGSFKVLGVNTWSIRLMPALFGIGGALLVFFTAYQLFNRRAAWWSVGALVCNPIYFLAAHYANMDLEIAIWVSAALCLFLLARKKTEGSAQRRNVFWWAWAAIGCGILTKGLIGLVFPAMVVGVWVVIGWRWRELKHWYFVSGLFVTLAICLPWYLAVQHRNPQFFHYFFIYQQFERFSGGGFNNVFPFWFYAPVVFVGLIPWALCLPIALYNQWRCAFSKMALADADSRQILLLWPLLIFIFFSIPASKIVGYILPVIPPLAILIGEYIDRKLTMAEKNATHRSLFIKTLPALPVTGVILAVALLLIIPRFEKEGIQPLVSELQAQWQTGDEIICYRNYFQDLPLYVQSVHPLKVVEDWSNPEILKDDNWRREFYFGLQDQPEAKEWLIDETDFYVFLKTHTRVFVFARKKDLGMIEKKYSLKIISQTEKNVLLLKE